MLFRPEDGVPEPQGLFLADVVNVHKGGNIPNEFEKVGIMFFCKVHLEFGRVVKVIFDRPLPAARNNDYVFDSGFDGFFYHVLENRRIDDRKHFLWHGLRCRQETGSKAGCGDDCFFDIQD